MCHLGAWSLHLERCCRPCDSLSLPPPLSGSQSACVTSHPSMYPNLHNHLWLPCGHQLFGCLFGSELSCMLSNFCGCFSLRVLLPQGLRSGLPALALASQNPISSPGQPLCPQKPKGMDDGVQIGSSAIMQSNPAPDR